MRKITVLKNGRFISQVQIEKDGKVWTEDWLNEVLEIEQMQDRISSIVNPELVEEFREKVRQQADNEGWVKGERFGYRNGVEANY